MSSSSARISEEATGAEFGAGEGEAMKQRTPRVLSQAAQNVIADVYLVGSVPADPPLMLKDVARSVSIVGRMLDGLADRYGVRGKGLARVVTIAGSVLWGMVELAVPDSFWQKISRNWYALLALSGIVIIALGLMTNTAGMASIGVELIFAVFVLRLMVATLRQFMSTGDLCERCIRTGVLIVAALAVIGVTVYLVVLHSQGIADKLSCLAQFFANLHKPKYMQPKP
jgi:hypothetical protein